MSVQTLTSAQVAKIAGMSIENFRVQFARDHWRLFGNERPGDIKGHSFTFGQALVYALARKLSEAGFSAGEAFDLVDEGSLSGDAFSVALFGLEQSSVDAYFGKTGRALQTNKPLVFVAYPRRDNIAAWGECVPADQLVADALFRKDVGDPVDRVVLIDLAALRDRLLAELTSASAAA